jgi:branched-chain amino acid transport system ATP-binding protein
VSEESKMLEVKGLKASYGEVQVLNDISFDVYEGEIVCLLGSNGSGKTTILKVISGIIPQDDGKIFFQGEDISQLEAHLRVEKGIAHVPEGRRLFPKLTVLENLKMGAYSKKARSSLDETLEVVHEMFPILKERQNQTAATLSGGEQQMLTIARGLMSQPKLLMPDELSLGLAPKLVADVLGLMQQLKDRGYTILLVEQNARQALKIGDRAYIINIGRMLKSGYTKELVEDPVIKKAYLGL